MRRLLALSALLLAPLLLGLTYSDGSYYASAHRDSDDAATDWLATITTQDVYYPLTGTALTCGSVYGFTCANSALTESSTIDAAGKYRATFAISGEMVSGSDEVHIAIGIGGTKVAGCHGTLDFATVTFRNVSSSCIITVAAGNVITLMVENDDGVVDFNVHDASLVLSRL